MKLFCRKICTIAKGMHDYLPSECEKHRFLINNFTKLAKRYRFQEIRTPTIESTELYFKGLGESDVVQKEMYSFKINKSQYTLRPEFTASVVRSLLPTITSTVLPCKYYYSGLCFRHEKPQLGRYREFTQCGLEYIGNDDISSDVEIIQFCQGYLHSIFEGRNVNDIIQLNINSLGDEETMQNYIKSLNQYFTQYKEKLSHNSQDKLKRNNILRILDSKDKEDQEYIQNSPLISDYYSQNSKIRLNTLLDYLKELNIPFVYNPKLVRGLDYYNDTVFEYVSKNGAVIGGGRYDKLFQHYNNKINNIACIGCACGVERLCFLIENFHKPNLNVISIIPIVNNDNDHLKNKDIWLKCFKLSQLLIKNGIVVNLRSIHCKVGKKFKNAANDKDRFCITIGENEVKENKISIKDLTTGKQQSVDDNEIVQFVNNIIDII